MRDAICNEFSQVDVISEENRIKRWEFINYLMKEIVEFADTEIETIQSLYRNSTISSELTSILCKMKILKRKKFKCNLI